MFYNSKKTFKFYMTRIFEENNLPVTGDNIAEWDYIFEDMENDIKEIIRGEIEVKMKELEDTIKDISRETSIDEYGCEIEDLKDKMNETEHDIKNINDEMDILEKDITNLKSD